MLSETDMGKLKKVQRAAKLVILPHLDYKERLQVLDIPTLQKFLLDFVNEIFTRLWEMCHNPSKLHKFKLL